MNKTLILTSLKQLFSNRYLATLVIVQFILALLFIVYIAFTVRPSELQVVTHFTAFGVRQLYTDQWWYLLSFAIFGLLTAGLHTGLAAKLFELKGRPMAIMALWLGIGIILFAWIMSFYLINVRNMI